MSDFVTLPSKQFITNVKKFFNTIVENFDDEQKLLSLIERMRGFIIFNKYRVLEIKSDNKLMSAKRSLEFYPKLHIERSSLNTKVFFKEVLFLFVSNIENSDNWITIDYMTGEITEVKF